MSSPAPPELKRHYRSMSEKDTDEVIGTVAELIVLYLKQRGGLTEPQSNQAGERGPDG